MGAPQAAEIAGGEQTQWMAHYNLLVREPVIREPERVHSEGGGVEDLEIETLAKIMAVVNEAGGSK